MVSMTYGTLPTQDEFLRAFANEVEGTRYRIRAGLSDRRIIDDGDYTSAELWVEVQKLTYRWLHGQPFAEQAGNLASAILETLGFEWI